MNQQTIPIEKAVAIAIEMHQAGQFERAQAMYVEILRQDPSNIDAIHLLGVLANQGGRPDVAIELIGRALKRQPDQPIINQNYADALARHGKREEALKYFRRAIELNDEYSDAYNNMSRALLEMDRFEEAADAARKAIDLDDGDAIAHNNLGNALRGLLRDGDAIPHYRAAVKSAPKFAEAMNNLGLALVNVGEIDSGVEHLHKAIALQPLLVDAHNNLGVILANLGRPNEAVKAFETAIGLDPKHADAHSNLGATFRGLGQTKESLEEIEEAIKLKPDSAAIQVNYAQTLKDLHRFDDALVAINKYLEVEEKSVFGHYLKGMILRDAGKPDEAIDVLRSTLALDPERSDVLSTLGYSLQERGELDEALEVLNKAISLTADPQTHSNALMVVCYHPHYTPQQHFEAHRAFGRAHEDPLKALWAPHTNSRDPERRLRIGYFSPDMRGHVVSYFSTPIFINHEHENFEIFAYSNSFHQDVTTLIQRARFDHWRETAGKSHDAIAKMIRKDGIDILVELAGHTGGNGLPVLARRAAPVQINAIGFPSTTGLTAVDYRLTDKICDPPGIAEVHNSEKLLYMPDCFWVYQPPREQIEIGPLPADRNGYVTFVSVNNFTKVTPEVLEVWARTVAATPNSKILMQTGGLSSAFVKDKVRSIFAARGVSADRIDLRTSVPFVDYLKLLESCDIMLDPFPFNGGTTTCHGLWMGNALVTLEGQMHAGRVGLSMLHCIGLPELVAKTQDEYVQIASGLAKDLPRLRAIRSGMRDRLTASPLLDAPRYVKNLENNYRSIWREWCAAGTS